MEVKLKKVLDRVKGSQAQSPHKKRQGRSLSKSSQNEESKNDISVTLNETQEQDVDDLQVSNIKIGSRKSKKERM